MAYDLTAKAIGKRLDDLWDKSTVLLSENLPAGTNPPWNSGSPWIRWSIRPADNQTADCTGIAEREIGVVYFQVFIPEDKGTRLAGQIARKLATIFNAATFAADDGTVLRFQRVKTVYAGKDGGWQQYNLTVVYTGDSMALNADGVAPVITPLNLPTPKAVLDFDFVVALTGGGVNDLDGVDVDAYRIGVGRTISITINGAQQFRKLTNAAPTGDDVAVKNHAELSWVQTGGLE